MTATVTDQRDSRAGKPVMRRGNILLLLLVFFWVWLPVAKAQTEIIRSSGISKYDLGSLQWKLFGYRPDAWRMNFSFTDFSGTWAEYSNIPVEVPGSVRKALLDAGIIPDWNYALNSISSEWVENRHWIFTTRIPDAWVPDEGEKFILHCEGLDDNGVVMVNGRQAGTFNNTFLPYSYDITSFLKSENNTLAIVFFSPPRHLGQIGFTSRIKDWKPRFYYGWDWIPRIVQIGIWDRIWLSVEESETPHLQDVRITTDAVREEDKGILRIIASPDRNALEAKVLITLSEDNGRKIREGIYPVKALRNGMVWDDLKINRWWPNGLGKQPLYRLELALIDDNGGVVQKIIRKVGFRNIEWLPCEGAAANADPWICSVNGKPFFLQGVNWTPIRPNFADLKEKDYRKRLSLYKELGINVIRVWGGGFPEKDWLYELCSELGILIWQDFPLSSSGIDNYPPEGPDEILVMMDIVRHYVLRLEHHPSLLLWCGGNELYNRENTTTITTQHPMIGRMEEMIHVLDPARRFTPGSPSGPNISATRDNFGQGRNWDTHGPWWLPFSKNDKTMSAVKAFWKNNDALFISESGVAGTMSADMIRKYAEKYNPLPANRENPVWRNVNWWIEWNDYLLDHNGGAPKTLEEYVNWSQDRQREGLTIAMKSCKERFPRCGGLIIWMGHDSYPCFSNTSIIDFEGNPKPAAVALSKIWKNNGAK